MNLSLDQMEDISYLRDQEAFKNILKSIEMEIAYTLDCMDAFDDNIDVKLLPYLKALRKILFLLKIYPDTIAEELKKYRESILQDGIDDILMRKPSNLQLKALESYYKERFKEQKKEMEKVV